MSTRDHRQRGLRHLVQSAARSTQDEESVIANGLDYLDDLDEAIGFMTRWTGGPVLGLQAGERTDRWGLNLRLSERAQRDVEFRRELLRRPRYLSAMAVHEAMGISPLEFLWQIKAVSVVEETAELHWLVLPACHRGCETRDASLTPPRESCAVCGRPLGGGCDGPMTVPQTDADRIHAVDDFIARTVAADESARARLLADPDGFFAQACGAMLGVPPRQAFGIQQVRILADTQTALHFVLLSKPSHVGLQSPLRNLCSIDEVQAYERGETRSEGPDHVGAPTNQEAVPDRGG
jgi:hypothetical protein